MAGAPALALPTQLSPALPAPSRLPAASLPPHTQSSRLGVSPTNVDRAMDSLMDTVFSSAFLAATFPLEEDDQRYI